ncbi:TPA: hypothetical protein P2N00_000506 [Aeromonas salmonicida]|uniref:Uncharacterized protein n=1 Tax=Aeromonas salmonicida subsp. salmonicida TaxID=29491 RepID=A0A0A7KTY4_AERSS|nr:hypothetical protein [Aeromonas salmonicida]AIZ49627.1 hypothetical protein [Aeromonas salmonicida subsp. salmonicida]ELY1969539.1 hypothetical protein [Aeromonas salmonicida]ELY2003678.1 hypothetical protein [Aeromonas salmonicida]MCR4454253.1 hypothetical protein [Aeromonas salmonicida]OAH88274.1 hypothetical protein AXW79_01445 [Aeromonas salmonicida subsp. salmonicida]
MGTRNLTCAVVDGKYKVAQYGQWDGYPSGQGATALQFLLTMDRENFITKLRAARFANDEDLDSIQAELEAAESGSSRGMMAEGGKYQQFSRDRGASILNIVAEAEPGILLKDRLSFAADSLFCEWAYVVDFDKGTFEVFQGFNEAPVPEGERFHGATSDDPSPGYYPVRLVKTYQLDALPTHEQFLADVEQQDEE